MIDEVLSGTAKADSVPGGMDNGRNISVDDQPPSQLQVEPEQNTMSLYLLIGDF